MSGDDGIPDPGPEAVRRARRAEYLLDAPERVRELSAALGRLRARDRAALGDLQRFCSLIAESGALHGFPEITDRATAAASTAGQLADRSAALQREDFASLEAHVLAIAEAFRRAQGGFGPGAAQA